MEKARVLIVDDSRAIQTIIRRGLAKVDSVEMETRVANDGVEAFDIARSWAPQLILADWHMPNMNGLELLQAINQEMLGIKLGFVTSETCQARLDEARDAGAKFIVNKPFNMEELTATLLPVLQQQTEVTVYDEDGNSKARLADIEYLQQTVASKCPFTVSLTQAEPISAESIKPPFAMGFYHQPDQSKIAALCLMDMQAAWVIGASANKTSPQKLRELLQHKKLPTTYINSCEAMAKTLGASFTDSANHSKPLQLNRFNFINKSFPKLKSLLSTATSERMDVNITAPGCGNGRLILVTS
ncbi:response regulator [Halioxenophilus aromaticivorans]|uniref:Response regulatory domain-containing protein n=1 Tax=Halioxenophilus aromaticivorans TaxID=1306992 RepID=A0AAV3U5N6_9ALTE